MSKVDEAVLIAYKKGYKVIDGKVISPFSKKELKLTIWKSNRVKGYKRATFSVRGINDKTIYKVLVHKLVAYQKFGKAVFENKVVVRHLDSNCLNNVSSNIAIGSQSDNVLDIPKAKRMEKAIKASTTIRKFTDSEVIFIKKRYAKLRSYKRIMEEFSITSKGTLHYILNNKYVTFV